MNNISTFIEFVNEGTKRYWSIEKCREEALKYDTRRQFEKNSHRAYQAAYKYGWMDEVCSHMKHLKKPNGYWTKEKCHEEALKYTSRTDFSQKSPTPYGIALRNGWRDEICSHMVLKQNPGGYWTKEKCHEEALKYDIRGIFHQNSTSAYDAARRNGWLDEICSHMEIVGSILKRIVYAYEFSDNCVYIGLTYKMSKRNSQHTEKDSNSSVYKHIKETGLIPKLSKLTEKFVDASEAQDLEEYYIKIYKENGWTVLNKSKPRGLGGSTVKWTFDNIKKEALKYKTRTEFAHNSGSAYYAALFKGWLDDVCTHMKQKVKWTYEKCKKDALKYKTRTEFFQNSPSACLASRKNGWLDEFFPKKEI